MKIRNVSHTLAGADPAAFALALEVAYELHATVLTVMSSRKALRCRWNSSAT
ncbi:hypothetical protein AB0H92_47755 [Streptomyces phaeochromogenes]|uniref:hypothetical protein n=1 Tax=Streptomyces phaeochromogenes TaxID=1923 RepID=UPI003406BAF1